MKYAETLDTAVSKTFFGIAVFSLFLLLSLAAQVSAHGGKGHGENEFTSLKALEKAVGMYDELIAKGKLDPGWETGLSGVEIRIVELEGGSEYEVSFRRKKGSPGVLYIFFSMDGNYTGSNFSGK